MKVKALDTRNASLRKKVHRLRDKIDKSKIEQKDCNVPIPSTPKSRARTEVSSLNITPKSRKQVQKQLFFKNCLLGDTKESALEKMEDLSRELF